MIVIFMNRYESKIYFKKNSIRIKQFIISHNRKIHRKRPVFPLLKNHQVDFKDF